MPARFLHGIMSLIRMGIMLNLNLNNWYQNTETCFLFKGWVSCFWISGFFVDRKNHFQSLAASQVCSENCLFLPWAQGPARPLLSPCFVFCCSAHLPRLEFLWSLTQQMFVKHLLGVRQDNPFAFTGFVLDEGKLATITEASSHHTLDVRMDLAG